MNSWALNLVLAACHAVTGTITGALPWVVIPNGETMRGIAGICAIAIGRRHSGADGGLAAEGTTEGTAVLSALSGW